MSDGFISNKKILTYRIIVHNILCVRIFSLIFLYEIPFLNVGVNNYPEPSFGLDYHLAMSRHSSLKTRARCELT